MAKPGPQWGWVNAVVLTNMAAELGAETGIIEPDVTTTGCHPGRRYRARGMMRLTGVVLLMPTIVPYMNSMPALSNHRSHRRIHLPIQVSSATTRTFSIDQAYIGACVGAKLTDLHMVAERLDGRTVARRTRLLIAPASQQVINGAVADGTMRKITESGAYLLPTGCGACAALGAGILAEDEVCISVDKPKLQRSDGRQFRQRFTWVRRTL